jgi:hypothetical protein
MILGEEFTVVEADTIFAGQLMASRYRYKQAGKVE